MALWPQNEPKMAENANSRSVSRRDTSPPKIVDFKNDIRRGDFENAFLREYAYARLPKSRFSTFRENRHFPGDCVSFGVPSGRGPKFFRAREKLTQSPRVAVFLGSTARYLFLFFVFFFF